MKAFLRFLVRAIALRVLRVSATYSPSKLALLHGGGVIVCANHVSLLDGVIIALASPSPLVFGVDTAFSRRSWVASQGMALLAALGFGSVVPIDAGSPYGIRTLHRALRRGQSVMVFPEGRISDTGRSLPEMPGVGWLVDRTKAQVVQVTIRGAEKSFLFAKSGRAIWPRIEIVF
ncbi:MAG TPA: 1-acyl-sn-glycerol-3-phosphate acyltransferase [Noviherbaspirillum sp.]|nr:1-acyl-sn-glycerol-3-phosphate acyltransferase [Noviherbaspirillum sp.]